MTTLDEICYTLKIHDKIIEGDQLTPTFIRLVLLEKDFIDHLENLKEFNAKLRFMEKKLFNRLDVHLQLTINSLPLNLTLRVVNSTKKSYQNLKTLFPNTEIFIEEIKEKEGI